MWVGLLLTLTGFGAIIGLPMLIWQLIWGRQVDTRSASGLYYGKAPCCNNDIFYCDGSDEIHKNDSVKFGCPNCHSTIKLDGKSFIST